MTTKVPKDIDTAEMIREVARQGHQIVDFGIQLNPINNKPTGKGFVQIRGKDKETRKAAKAQVEAFGVKLTKKVPNKPSAVGIKRQKKLIQ